MARIRREAPRRLNLALLALVLLLGAAAGWVWTLRASALAREADEADAVAAASTHAVSLMSLDHRTFDTAFRGVVSTSTGETRARYERDQVAAREAVMKDKVLQTGVLRGAGLASMNAEGTRAQVLVVADVLVDFTGRKDDRLEDRFYRWRMDLAKENGRWLVANAELVS
ncbi:hypothetical protein GT755_27900 [Herbidospora sp. NEAU-GS84]|uniref:Mce-associated membrane protein n=1 Tax=Herbidospora solisilvae TaxID=2696284 RepID=A0A7C9NA45_9ACTN|nr:hypothetical protein [Herbidospora solisilvae]NAS25493.1 hypothetical protein [Herbidospora solisilvae]